MLLGMQWQYKESVVTGWDILISIPNGTYIYIINLSSLLVSGNAVLYSVIPRAQASMYNKKKTLC